MSFASLEFFLFLPVVFALYYACAKKSWQNSVIVLASYAFYAAWDYRFCGLMLVSSLLDYGAGLLLESSRRPFRRRVILAVSLTANLGLLGFFKYFNFFVDSFAVFVSALGIEMNTSTISIILPVGISFYTFQTMSYTLDRYWGKIPTERNCLQYLAFVSFFPQLVAGPIERASRLLPQFNRVRIFEYGNGVAGVRLVLWGLAKKMILADNLGAVVDLAYGAPERVGAPVLAMATVFFAFQIYCDFSAYSDIAAGVAKLFGIELSRNFAYPYFAQSLTEFWRRWHISLSSWFRDYIYIPLGGSQAGGNVFFRNLFLVFLLSGLWHGASWTFVIWGALHGVLLSLEKWAGISAGALRAGEIPGSREGVAGMGSVLRIGATFFVVCCSWVLFRAPDVGAALDIYRGVAVGMMSIDFYGELVEVAKEHWVVLLQLACFVGLEWVHRNRWNPLPDPAFSRGLRWATYTVVFWCIIYFGTERSGPFIYFQF